MSDDQHVSDTRSLQQEELGNSSEEERRGLLSNGTKGYDDDSRPWWSLSLRTIVYAGATLVLLVIGIVVGVRLFAPSSRLRPDFDNRLLRSNGTHDFRKTALIVSIDGLR